MFANNVVADGKLLSKSQISVYQRFIVQRSKHQPLLVIALVHLQPHPFGFACLLTTKFRFNEIAGLVSGIHYSGRAANLRCRNDNRVLHQTLLILSPPLVIQ